MTTGKVYTETVVHAAPAQFAADAPYQLAIVALEEGGRLMGRIDGARVEIGDAVELVERRAGVPFFRKR
ncbi:MAG: Zn-ribbon domain-containing OB-fold protein [Bryobacteraceae bacterium]